jgi:hypothetical protein
MGEIKSTMDIIMEKTKGLTMSEEEKAEYKQKELAGKVRGLIQKVLDDVLDLDRCRMEMAALSGEQEQENKGIIVEESITHIKLGANNEPVFRILQETADVDVKPIHEMENAFTKRIEDKLADREKSLKEKLEKKGVSGSAVIPNIRTDPDWQQYLSDENEAFKADIRSHLRSE